MARFGEINAQYFDDAGDPLGSGKLYFYDTGTTTPKNTYSDINFTIPNPNPVILTAAGRQPNIFFDGVAKAILADKNDVQILARDPVGETGTNFGDPWVATKIYSTNAVVIGTDGVYYRSLVAGNQNNNPTTTSGFWSLLYSVQWNAGISYQEGSVVTYDGEQFQSLTNNNVNNNPSISAANWVLLSFAWISTAEYALNQNAVGTDGVLYTSQQAANTGNDPTDPANRPTYWVGTSADAATSAAAAAVSAAAALVSENAAELAETNAETAQAAAEAAQAAAETAETNAETAETNSAASAAASATSAVAAATSETNAATSAADAAATYDQFDDRYLGVKASDPATDNDGNPLVTGALYFSSTTNTMRVYNGSGWQDTASITTSVSLSQVSDFPSQTGESGKFLTTNGSVPSWAELSTNPTLGTLTKTFANNESSTISLTGSVLAPVVTVTKEVPQTGTTNNNWDVLSTDENYELDNSAYSTTLDFTDYSIANTELVATYNTTELIQCEDFVFGDNGTKIYYLDTNGDHVEQYNLSTAYDVSTSAYYGLVYVGAQETNIGGIAFKSDGTKMYVVGYSTDRVHQYSLSTAWDITTATYDSVSFLISQTTAPRGLDISNDGTKMYVGDLFTPTIFEYNLSTAWDISTSVYNSVSLTVTAPVTISDAGTLRFNSNGTNLYIQSNISGVGVLIIKYSLSTAYDLSTAVSANQFLYTTQYGLTSNVRGVAVNPDETKLYFNTYSLDTIYELNILPTILTLGTGSFSSEDVGKSVIANNGTFLVTSASGNFNQVVAPSSYNQVIAGNWSLSSVVYNAVNDDLKLSSALSNLQNISNSGNSYSFPTGTQPFTLRASADGTKFFHVDPSRDTVYATNLSTAWDITTASAGASLSVAAQETLPRGVQFNNDGTRVYVCGDTGDDINQYSLSTPYDLSTGTFLNATSYAAETTIGKILLFNGDGKKLYLEATSNSFVRYSLSTAYDTSTISYDGVEDILPSFVDSINDAQFYNNGSRLYVVSTWYIWKYSLSTPYDLSTATLSDKVSTNTVSAQNNGLVVKFDDDSKIFVIESQFDRMTELNAQLLKYSGYAPAITKTSTDTTYWTDINSMTADQNAGDGNVYYAISTDDRTTWTVIDNTDGERDIVRNNAGTWQYNSNGTYASETWVNGTTNAELATLAEAMEGASSIGNKFNISTSSFVDSFSIAAQDGAPRGLAFNSDGTKMFVVGSLGDEVNEYNLSTGFDVSTASYSQVFSVNAQDTNPNGLAFNADGTKMFIAGGTGQDINEYALTTGFDVSTASFTQNFSVSAQDTSPQGLAFNADGTKMFVVGTAGQDVNEYTLSTGFNISTASFVDSFSIAAQENTPHGLAFNTDGTKMYVVGQTGQDVNEYTLTTGFDVSTASYSQSFSVSSQDIYPYGIAFNTDGTKMFVGGGQGTDINEYTLGTTVYTNQMDKTQLDAVTDPNHIALGNDLDLAIVFNMTSGSTAPSSDGVAINYDANVLNKGAVLGTDYDFDAPAQNKVRITALAGNNLKVRVV